MECVIEFGVKRGAHTENLKVPTEKLAIELAAKLVMVFSNDPFSPGANVSAWPTLRQSNGRLVWESKTHFVAVTLLDGRLRGPASAGVWNTFGQAPRFEGPH